MPYNRDYVAKGKVKVMTEIFPLEEISSAYDKVANGNCTI